MKVKKLEKEILGTIKDLRNRTMPKDVGDTIIRGYDILWAMIDAKNNRK